MAKYLDETGLGHLIEKIKSVLIFHSGTATGSITTDNTTVGQNATYSFSVGYCTEVNNSYEVAMGSYNISHYTTPQDLSQETVFSIGIGTSAAPGNAMEVVKNGDVYMKGIGGYDGTSLTDVDSIQDVVGDLDGALTWQEQEPPQAEP